MQVHESFEQWKEFLSNSVQAARAAGASQADVKQVATQIGDVLAANVDPANREQRLLKELWSVGNQQEREALAGMITRMVSDGHRH